MLPTFYRQGNPEELDSQAILDKVVFSTGREALHIVQAPIWSWFSQAVLANAEVRTLGVHYNRLTEVLKVHGNNGTFIWKIVAKDEADGYIGRWPD